MIRIVVYLAKKGASDTFDKTKNTLSIWDFKSLVQTTGYVFN